MNKLWSLLDSVQNKMKIGGAVCLAGMASVTCVSVAARLLGYPVFGAEEIVAILTTLVIAFSLPYAHKEKAHIGVEILMHIFSIKTQHIVKLCTDVVSFCLFCIVTWRMFLYAQTIQESGQVTMNLQLPGYYVIYALSFCFFIFSFSILRNIIESFRKAGGK